MRSRGHLRITSIVVVFPLLLIAVSLLAIFFLALAKQCRRWYAALLHVHHAHPSPSQTITRATAALALTVAGTDDLASDTNAFKFDASNAIVAESVVATAAAHAHAHSSPSSFAAFLKFLNVTPLGFSLSSTLVLLAVVALVIIALRLAHYKQFAKNTFDAYMERLSEIRFPGSMFLNTKKIPNFWWLSRDSTSSSAQDAKRRRSTNDLLSSSSSALSPSTLPTHNTTRLHKKISSSRPKIDRDQTRPRSRSNASTTGHGHASPHKYEPVASSMSKSTTSSELEVAGHDDVEADADTPNRTSITIQVTDTTMLESINATTAITDDQIVATTSNIIDAQQPQQAHITTPLTALVHDQHESDNKATQSDDHSDPALVHTSPTDNPSPLNEDDKPLPTEPVAPVTTPVAADDSNDEGKFVAAGEKRRRRRTRGNAKTRTHHHQQQQQEAVLEVPASPMQPQLHSQAHPQSQLPHKQHGSPKRHVAPVADAIHPVLAPSAQIDLPARQHMNIVNEPISRESNSKRHHRHSYPSRSATQQQQQQQPSNDYVPRRSSLVVANVNMEEPAVSQLPAKPVAPIIQISDADNATAVQLNAAGPRTALQQPRSSVSYARITAHQQHHHHHHVPRSSVVGPIADPRAHSMRSSFPISPATLAVPTLQSQWYSPFVTGLDIDLVSATSQNNFYRSPVALHSATPPVAGSFNNNPDPRLYHCRSVVGAGLFGAVGRARTVLEDEERGAVAQTPLGPAQESAGWGLFGGVEAPCPHQKKDGYYAVGAVGAGRRGTLESVEAAEDAEEGKGFSFFDRTLAFSQGQ